MEAFVFESAILLLCFGSAFAVSVFVDRLFRRLMSHFARGIVAVVVSAGFLMVAVLVYGVLRCGILRVPCDS
jgi:hypothetical protein